MDMVYASLASAPAPSTIGPSPEAGWKMRFLPAQPSCSLSRLEAMRPEDHANAKVAGFDSLMIEPLTEESLRALLR
jgi:hypothetical protein